MSPQARTSWFFETCADEYNLAFASYIHNGEWWGRFSAQVYTDKHDFEYCGETLAQICAELKLKHDSLGEN